MNAMIQTSYFANKDLSRLGSEVRLVAISQGIPKWFRGDIFRPLAPSWQLVRINDVALYKRLYKEQVLDRLDPVRIARQLDNSILLCWERPGQFCHRRLVAEWLEKATGIVVPEYVRVSPPVKINQEPEQLNMF